MSVYHYAEHLKIASILETSRLNVDEIEYPALARVHAYWDAVRGDAFAPSLRQFRIEDLDPAIIPSMAIVDFLGPPLDFFYRFFGSHMVEIAGLELTGKRYYADNVEGYGFVNAEIFPLMIAEAQPLVHRTKWVSVKGLHYVTTTVRLPLSADGDSVTGGITVNQYQSADI